METILVVNAGSSSVKFQIFAAEKGGAPKRLLKGQCDGIGARPHLRAESAERKTLVDKSYTREELPDIMTALQATAIWLRETQNLKPTAVGHRVVHGGPSYDRPVFVDHEVLSRLEEYISLAPLHQP